MVIIIASAESYSNELDDLLQQEMASPENSDLVKELEKSDLTPTTDTSQAESISTKLNAYKKTERVDIELLDKISTKVTKLDYKVNSKNHYKNLEIIAFNCLTNGIKNDNELLLLGIWEHNEDSGELEKVFLGWLFSKDKNITQIEHKFITVSNFHCK